MKEKFVQALDGYGRESRRVIKTLENYRERIYSPELKNIKFRPKEEGKDLKKGEIIRNRSNSVIGGFRIRREVYRKTD